MFGLGKLPCVVCDHPVPRTEAVAVRDRKDIGVCKACLARWRREGALCTHCKTPVVGAQEHGIFLDRYVFGHYDCGASALGLVRQ
jgi:predicted amidophosphoribosyltransferase